VACCPWVGSASGGDGARQRGTCPPPPVRCGAAALLCGSRSTQLRCNFRVGARTPAGGWRRCVLFCVPLVGRARGCVLQVECRINTAVITGPPIAGRVVAAVEDDAFGDAAGSVSGK
jgi:hypothetical protein